MVPVWVDVMVLHWMFIIWLQFQSHISMMDACDELIFGGDNLPWKRWWMRYREHVDRHSLGLFVYCLANFSFVQVQMIKDAIRRQLFIKSIINRGVEHHDSSES